MCHQWFTGIIKTWFPRLALAGFLASNAAAQTWQEGVIVQKTGDNLLFVFPSSKGNITAVARPAGRIKVGSNIEIIYAIQVGQGNARFIAVEGSAIPDLQVTNKKSATLGFYIKDTSQGRLNIHLDSRFVHEIGKKAVQQKIGREGNLNVIIGRGEKVKFRIISVNISGA